MKVLFISSGNSLYGISPIIKNQGESLRKVGVDIEFFSIKGKGVKGYLKEIPRLRKHLKRNNYDVFHAHFSLSGYVASLAGAKPLVVSLMGSDVKSKSYLRFIIKAFSKFFWSKVIVKSEDMSKSIKMKGITIIPNGVDFFRFKPLDKITSVKELGWDSSKKNILFAANPNKVVKNFKFAKMSYSLMESENIELHSLDNVLNERMPYYFNAADTILLTSLWEGSPNVIKEAMACNRPIVSTDVGDVKWLLKDVDGCAITKLDKNDCALKLKYAMKYSAFKAETNGRDRLIHLGLDDQSVAKKIFKVYNSLI